MGKRSQREAFGKALVKVGEKNDNIMVLDADLANTTKTDYFSKVYPSRFINVGIAEQNLLGVASGIASCGKNAFCSSFAVFQTGRGYEIIRNTIALGNLNVKICSTHAGINTGEDGATHQSIEDIGIMRVLPNMKVFVPADYNETKAIVEYLESYEGPAYLRMSRSEVEDIYGDNRIFEIGKADILVDGSDITIFACGPMVAEAINASQILKNEGIEARVVNVSCIKPLDEETILKCANETKKIFTIEDHNIIGGLGSAISEFLSENKPMLIKRIGVEDTFGMSGNVEELYDYYGLKAEKIAKKINDFINSDF